MSPPASDGVAAAITRGRDQLVSAQQKAFNELKRLLSQVSVLVCCGPDAVAILSADASAHGISAVLLQMQPDGRLAAIA